ncbi:MAG TPA: tetratricopeptide repeat protein [Pyrinomonadaceae bacterium]|nr:tetratricopeptide repeat protein [Pyrinomonadaceae bacterium]
MGNAVGLTLFHARRCDGAVESLRKVLKLEKNSPTTRRGLGNAYAANRMFAEAIACYQEATRLSGGNHPGFEALLGAFYVKMGERGKAEEILQKLKAKGNESSSEELAVLYD